jgi:alcohol dehydrogenase
MLAEHARAPLPMDMIISYELEIKGSHGMQAWRYPEMMEMISRGVLAPQKLIKRRIRLDEAPAALVAMDKFEGTGITIITA